MNRRSTYVRPDRDEYASIRAGLAAAAVLIAAGALLFVVARMVMLPWS